ncbi:unnamed protein product [Calicophoron daubneyi]|uniref:Uncharacterized protein n=1 Tax=Calicophoron daubneyi TaxID=300641 RepID=A0AAV2TDL3_CALDB
MSNLPLLLSFLVTIHMLPGTSPVAVVTDSTRGLDMLSSTTPPQKPDPSGEVCVDFVGILIDHFVQRLKTRIQDPMPISKISSSFFELENGMLYGLRSLTRTCPLRMKHEELWRRANNTQPNAEVTIPEWMMKRDQKIGDTLYLTFCLGIPSNLRLHGVMTVFSFWTTYGPEHVRITLSDISIKVRMSLNLNTTGRIKFDVDYIQVDKLEKIAFAEDSVKQKLGDEVKSDSGFISNYGGLAEWLVNGPLYTPLVIAIETLLKDSLSAFVKDKQERW